MSIPFGWKLLDGEFFHELIKVTSTEKEGNIVVAQGDIKAGTTIVLARGFDNGDTASVLCSIFEKKVSQDKQENMLFERMNNLCPSSISHSAEHYKKFHNDRDELEKLKQDVLPSSEGITIDDLILLEMKIDLNSLHHGLFPLASLFNHSCKANCVGYPSNEEDNVHEIRLIEDVQQGTQLTLNYLEERYWYLPVDQRRLVLSRRWFFECGCDRCTCVYDGEKYLESLNCNLKDCQGTLFLDTKSETFRCDKCQNFLPQNCSDELQTETYAQIQVAASEENIETQHQIYLSALNKINLHLNDKHWMKVVLFKRISETSFSLAQELGQADQEDEEKTKEFQEMAELHYKMLSLILNSESKIYPTYDYHISMIYEQLNYICGILFGEDSEEAQKNMNKMIEIRNVCGWMETL